jgi:hypothetical protein
MHNKIFLTNIKVSEGMFPNEKVVETANYSGRKISGFFHKENIKNNQLEIQVLSKREDKVLIFPKGGYFLEEGNDKIIMVNIKDLIYYN